MWVCYEARFDRSEITVLVNLTDRKVWLKKQCWDLNQLAWSLGVADYMCGGSDILNIILILDQGNPHRGDIWWDCIEVDSFDLLCEDAQVKISGH